LAKMRDPGRHRCPTGMGLRGKITERPSHAGKVFRRPLVGAGRRGS